MKEWKIQIKMMSYLHELIIWTNWYHHVYSTPNLPSHILLYHYQCMSPTSLFSFNSFFHFICDLECIIIASLILDSHMFSTICFTWSNLSLLWSVRMSEFMLWFWNNIKPSQEIGVNLKCESIKYFRLKKNIIFL